MRGWCAVALGALVGPAACLQSNPDWEEAEEISTSGTTANDTTPNATTPGTSTTGPTTSGTTSAPTTDVDPTGGSTGGDVTTMCDGVECGLGGVCVVDVASADPEARCDCPAGAVDLDLRCVVTTPNFEACGSPLQVGGVSTEGPEGPYGCPDGTWPSGLYTEYDSNDRLRGFRIKCHELISETGVGQYKWGNPAVGGENFGYEPLDYTQDLDCPPDQFITALRAFAGALEPAPGDFRVMDRIEVGCSTLTLDEGGTFTTSAPTYVAQELMGTVGLLDNNQVQQTGECPSPSLIQLLTTSGGGHTDHFDIECACPTPVG